MYASAVTSGNTPPDSIEKLLLQYFRWPYKNTTSVQKDNHLLLEQSFVVRQMNSALVSRIVQVVELQTGNIQISH